MRTQLRHVVGAVFLTGAISTFAAGCVAVPVPGPDYAYGPRPPVVVVPAPVYGGHYRGGYYYRGGYRRYHPYGYRHYR